MSGQQAGWYPDPSGDPTKLRYWDGSQWTNEYSEAPVAQPAAMFVEETFYAQPTAGQTYVPGQTQPIAQAQTVYVQTQTQPTNGYAIAALVCGILGLCTGTIIPSIVAIILAIIGKKNPGGQGMATAGLVLGIIGVVIWVVIWIIWGVAIFAAFNYPNYRF